MACWSWATTGPNCSCWSSHCANRCTPTNDSGGVTRTAARQEETGRWQGARRGRPLRRWSCRCARHRLRWRRLTAIGICRLATLSSSARLGHSGSSWSKVHNRAWSTSLSFRPAQKPGLALSSRLRWSRASCMTSSSLPSIAGCSLHIRPYGSMAIFILNKINQVATKPPNRVRSPFEYLIAEVGLGRAGAVLCLEASRLARSSSDWYRLIEICALTDTLVIDEDGVYDPGQYNDRLLLGFRGTMSEAELHWLHCRLVV